MTLQTLAFFPAARGSGLLTRLKGRNHSPPPTGQRQASHTPTRSRGCDRKFERWALQLSYARAREGGRCLSPDAELCT